MREEVIIFVNGIMNFPGDARGWTGRAITHTHLNSKCYGNPLWAEDYSYFTIPLARHIDQQWRAERIAKKVNFYMTGGWKVHLVGHSNGCDIILRCLNVLAGQPNDCSIESVHLISAACEADFEKNGLNAFCDRGFVKHLFVYIAGSDWAMALAYYTQKFLRFLGLGFGSLGRTGPIRNVMISGGVHVEPDYGHSTWFNDNNLKTTMERIITNTKGRHATTIPMRLAA